MSAAFDTLKLSRRLETVGFSHEQATGMAEVLNDALDAELVTRDYLDFRLGEVRGEIAGTKAELKADIAEIGGEIAEVRGEIAEVKAELKADIAEVQGEIAEIKVELKAEVTRLEGKIETESAAIRGQLGRIDWMLLLVIAAVVLPWIERIAAPLIGNSP